MIRIKVFPLKKIIYKLEISLAVTTFLIVLVLLVSLLCAKKDKIIKNILEHELTGTKANVNETKFINNILKSKIQIFSNVDFDDLGEKEEKLDIESIGISEEKIYDSNVGQINVKVVNVKEEKSWNKPKEYETKLYDNGKVQVGNVTISNYSKLILDLSELKIPSTYEFTDETDFLIFHTHTSETYTIEQSEYSDYYRTENQQYNVVSVGDTLEKELKRNGFKCMHEKTVHDYPSYNGAYKSSLKTVEEILKEDNFEFVVDIHRDAISSNSKFRPTTEVDGEYAAKLMFVIGTNSAGLSHDEWMKNLKLAIMIQNKANEMYPGLFRELHLSSSRYNQHVSNGAFILEVGATGNTLEEAQNSMKYFAEVINSMK